MNPTEKTRTILVTAARAAWTELSSEEAIKTYHTKVQSDIQDTLDFAAQVAVDTYQELEWIEAHFLQSGWQAYKLVLALANTVYCFYQSYTSPHTLAIAPTHSQEIEVIEGQIIETFNAQPLLLAPAITATAVSQAESWKSYVEACLGLKAWSEIINTVFTVKTLRAELENRGITPAPKTRKPVLVKLLVEGVK